MSKIDYGIRNRATSKETYECPECDGTGEVAEYEGWDMRCYGAECPRCQGYGDLPLNGQPDPTRR